MLDGVMGRVLELKHALVELEHSDYQYFDEILTDLKAIKDREKILDAMNATVVGRVYYVSSLTRRRACPPTQAGRGPDVHC
jgi:hypothetical protein